MQILATWISLPQTCPQLTLSQIKFQIHIKTCKWYSWKSYPLMGKLVYHWWYSYAPNPSHRVHRKGVGSYNHPVAQCAHVAFTWNGHIVHSPTSGEANVLAHWQMKTFSSREKLNVCWHNRSIISLSQVIQLYKQWNPLVWGYFGGKSNPTFEM